MPISRGEGRGLGMKVLFAFCLIFTWSWRSKGSSPSCLDILQSILLTLAGRRTVPFFCSVLGTEKWKPDQRQLPADPIDYYKVCRVCVTVSIVLHWKSSFILSIKTTGSSNRTPKRRPDRGVDLALEKHGCFFFLQKQHHTHLLVVSGFAAQPHLLQWSGAAIPDRAPGGAVYWKQPCFSNAVQPL